MNKPITLDDLIPTIPELNECGQVLREPGPICDPDRLDPDGSFQAYKRLTDIPDDHWKTRRMVRLQLISVLGMGIGSTAVSVGITKSFEAELLGAGLGLAPKAGAIGGAFLFGACAGAVIDHVVGEVIGDRKIDTLSEWLATKWSEASTLSISQPLPNQKGECTTGWRYRPE